MNKQILPELKKLVLEKKRELSLGFYLFFSSEEIERH